MAKITVYEKNKIDLSTGTQTTITVSDAVASDDGAGVVDLMRDRSNGTGWATTGSTDAANTQLDINTGDTITIDRIALINHNFKAYTLQYHNGVGYVDFSTPISETVNTDDTNLHTFNEITAHLFRLIIQGCQTVDDDKTLSQLIFTKQVGQFVAEPDVRTAIVEQNKRISKMMSGRRHIARRTGAFTCEMRFKPNTTQADQTLIKDIFASLEGRLFSLIGFDETDLSVTNTGFQKKDLFLMAALNDPNTAFHNGRFSHGVANVIKLAEVF